MESFSDSSLEVFLSKRQIVKEAFEKKVENYLIKTYFSNNFQKYISLKSAINFLLKKSMFYSNVLFSLSRI